MVKIRQALKPLDIAGLLSTLFSRFGVIRRPKPYEVSIGKETREINWHAVKAAIEAERERERRKWEYWGLYGRRL